VEGEQLTVTFQVLARDAVKRCRSINAAGEREKAELEIYRVGGGEFA